MPVRKAWPTKYGVPTHTYFARDRPSCFFEPRMSTGGPAFIEVLEATEDGIGSTFRQVYVEHGRRMEMHGEVTRYEANRRLTCEIRGDAFDLWVNYRLDDLGGRTRLTQESAVLFKGTLMRIMGAVMKPFIKKASLKQAEDAFANLKQLAEYADDLPAAG